jgi:hypothetical protein
MGNLFIVTSAISSHRSVIPTEQRFQQTLETIESIRTKVPDSIIVLAESSPQPIPTGYLEILAPKVDYLLENFRIFDIVKLGVMGLQSPAEAYSLFATLDTIEKLNLQPHRIFKLTGRGVLTDDFNIEDYNDPALVGKYVFKNRVQSWMSNDLQLVDTRIFSLCQSLIAETKEMMNKMVNHCLTTGRDLEHCTFELLDKQKLVERDIMGFKCQISSTGKIQFD